MAVPPVGATGLDTSDPATFQASNGILAPSSMMASEGFRQEVSDAALDAPTDPATENAGLSAGKALSLLRDASSQSRSYFEAFVHAPWQRSYRAVRNQHYDGSLYLSDAYKARSKIFKPKTRSALRKRLAMTAKAMFTPGNVVSVEPEDATNQQQVASAALKQEVLNYRLSTPTLRNGIPWFLTAMGARFDAEVTGMCCSKQFWNFKEDRTQNEIGPDGQPRFKVLVDKPDIMVLEPENVRFDPNCNWTNVAQLSSYLLLQFPMTADEAWQMVQHNLTAKVPWRKDLDENSFRVHAGSPPSETIGPRSAREGGKDPKQQASGAYKPVWLTEVFMRYQGRDYVFWAMDDSQLLSDPVPVEQVYPWCFGERPVVIGMGQLEPHRTYQMSAVESWQQSQQEINDLANLRLDYEKRIVSPPMKVTRGRKVDLQQVQRKGANSILLVQAMDDVQPMELPDVPQSAFAEANMLNNDMDDLSGIMDGSGTSARDAANETLGGMHLLAESANAVADFDLSLWSETWCQPVMLQLLKLEEHYETDATVLAIAGQRARLWEKYGVNEITDQFLRAETTAKVNLGVGATNLPMERLKRFSVAWDTAAKALAPFVQTKEIDVKPNAQAITDSIFHAAGFADGGQQFFEYIGPSQQPQQPPPPDPKAQAAMLSAQAKMQGNQIQQEKNQAQAMIDARKIEADRENLRMSLMNDAADRRTGLDIEHMKAMAEMEKTRRAEAQAHSIKAFDHVHDHHKTLMAPFMAALQARLTPQPAADAAKTANSPHGDPSRPMLAPKPSPHVQPQPGMFATL